MGAGGVGRAPRGGAHNPNTMSTRMKGLCEAVVAEAARRNVCVYHDNARDIVVSNNVYPTLADVDDNGSDAAKWDAINDAWRKIKAEAWCDGVAVEEGDLMEAGAPPCSRIRIPVALASEDLKKACTNGYPRPKRPATEEIAEAPAEAPAKRPATEEIAASEASEPAGAAYLRKLQRAPTVTITSRTVDPDTAHIDFTWKPLNAPATHRDYAESCLTRWTQAELDDLKAEADAGELGDRHSIPYHQAADCLATTNPDLDFLVALFTDVCFAILHA